MLLLLCLKVQNHIKNINNLGNLNSGRGYKKMLSLPLYPDKQKLKQKETKILLKLFLKGRIYYKLLAYTKYML